MNIEILIVHLRLNYDFKNIKMCYIGDDKFSIYLYHQKKDIRTSELSKFIGRINKNNNHPIIIDITDEGLDKTWTKLFVGDIIKICENCIPNII